MNDIREVYCIDEFYGVYQFTFLWDGQPVNVTFFENAIPSLENLFGFGAQNRDIPAVTCSMIGIRHNCTKHHRRIWKACGIALLNVHDGYDLVEGMKKAFENTIRNWTKQTRTKFWTEFGNYICTAHGAKWNLEKTKQKKKHNQSAQSLTA